MTPFDDVLHGEAPTPLAPAKAHRGFATLSADQRSNIARLGGKAAHAAGTAHEWHAKSAAQAGAKGGATTSANREHMSRIGKIGGAQRAAKAAAKRNAK